MSETRIVKILKSQDTSDNPIYFDPKYIEIQRGDTTNWINYDIRNHTLSSQIFAY
jgi:plastocyanin